MLLMTMSTLGLTLVGSPAVALSAAPVVTGLAFPAMFTVAPDGRIFYSERTGGRIRVFDPSTGSHSSYFVISDLCTAGDQGLYGLALHPTFATIPSMYAFATRRIADGSCHNQVLRIDGSTSAGQTAAVLWDDLHVAGHNGGRLLFGPDGNLYVSTGDGASTLPSIEQERAQRATAQDTSSPKGKILRMTASGGAPGDNPFGNVVFAYGFRNVFGFDFDSSTNQLWATDNGPDPSFAGDARGPGPSGGCNDEVNLVVKGGNYGWGPAGTCGEPPEAPYNSNQDGPNPIQPALNIKAASGITGARFCSGCGLGPAYEGRLLYVDYGYGNGGGNIRVATLSQGRTAVVSDDLVLNVPGPAPLSIERGPDGTMYYSDPTGIYKLTPGGGGSTSTTTTTTTPPGSSTAPTGLTVTNRTHSTVGLRWNEVNGATEYRAYVSTTPGSGHFLWASLPADTTATLYSLTGNAYIVMRAVVGGVESPNSNEVFAGSPR